MFYSLAAVPCKKRKDDFEQIIDLYESIWILFSLSVVINKLHDNLCLFSKLFLAEDNFMNQLRYLKDTYYIL